MALYKDKKTGAILSTESVLSGDWELVSPQGESITKKTSKTKKEKEQVLKWRHLQLLKI